MASSILSLPLEVRYVIYFDLLISIKPIEITDNLLSEYGLEQSDSSFICRPYNAYATPHNELYSVRPGKSAPFRSPLPGGSPTILRVCRQFFHEAEPVLYSFNTFAFVHSVHNLLPWFMGSISSQAYLSIKHLEITWCSKEYEYIDFIMGCRSLRSLCINGIPKTIPSRAIGLLSGLRVEHISFTGDVDEKLDNLKKTIEGMSMPRTSLQTSKSIETPDQKE